MKNVIMKCDCSIKDKLFLITAFVLSFINNEVGNEVGKYAVVFIGCLWVLLRRIPKSLNLFFLWWMPLFVWQIRSDYIHNILSPHYYLWWIGLLIISAIAFHQKISLQFAVSLFVWLNIGAFLCFLSPFREILFLNKAEYANAWALAIPACLYLYKQTKNRVLLLFIVCFSIAIVWAQSRTAMIAVLLLSCYTLLQKTTLKIYWKVCSLLVVSSVGIVLLYFLRPDAADGRRLIYLVILTGIDFQTFWGYGTQGFAQHYMSWQADFLQKTSDVYFCNLADDFSYPFNEYLRLLIVLGVVGIVCLGLAFRKTFSLNDKTKVEQQFYHHTFIILLALSLFSYPFSTPFILLYLAWLYGHALQQRSVSLSQGLIMGRRVLMGVCIMASVWLFCLEQAYAMATAVVATPQQRSWMKSIVELNPWRSDMLYAYAVQLNEEGDCCKSQEIAKLSWSRQKAYDTALLLGSNALEMGQYQEAECFLKRASKMIPARLMPLYGLMMTAEIRGDSITAKRYAQQTLKKQIKIPSAETYEIQNYAHHLLERYAP